MGHNEKASIHPSLKNFPHDNKFMSPLPSLLDHCERDKREAYGEAIILSKWIPHKFKGEDYNENRDVHY